MNKSLQMITKCWVAGGYCGKRLIKRKYECNPMSIQKFHNISMKSSFTNASGAAIDHTYKFNHSTLDDAFTWRETRYSCVSNMLHLYAGFCAKMVQIPWYASNVLRQRRLQWEEVRERERLNECLHVKKMKEFECMNGLHSVRNVIIRHECVTTEILLHLRCRLSSSTLRIAMTEE